MLGVLTVAAPRPAAALDAAAGAKAVAALEALQAAFTSDAADTREADDALADLLVAARPALLTELRRLRPFSLIEEIDAVLGGYHFFVVPGPDGAEDRYSWRLTGLAADLREAVRYADPAAARALAPAYDLVAAMDLLARKRARDGRRPRMPPRPGADGSVREALAEIAQTNYLLVGAEAVRFGGRVERTAGKKLSKFADDPAATIARRALRFAVAQGAAAVRDPALGLGTIEVTP